MIRQYIDTALSLAHYELIKDEEPYYGEVPQLRGVWATGKTLEECRQRLAEVIDDWVLVRLSRGLSIPRWRSKGAGLSRSLGPTRASTEADP